MLMRAQKRRVGERDLWDMIVNNDDICFKHILPKLNQTDIKFLYEVNSETRALVKRSSRYNVLKKKFKVNEMSSISTLEFAWEDRTLWLEDSDETDFAWEVAKTNKLELLRWAREEKGCEWDGLTIVEAAKQGNLEMIKYCLARNCPMNGKEACASAASGGHLEILKYLHEEVKAPWDWSTAEQAAECGHLHILEYLVECKFDEYAEWECEGAARGGHLNCLKYLHETAKVPLDEEVIETALCSRAHECVQYLLDKDCPLPRGWRYEDGTLFCEGTINQAAEDGDLEMVQYCVENNCPMDWEVCAYAAENDQLEILKYLHETANAPWDSRTASKAAKYGHISILKYLFQSGYDEYYGSFACEYAASGGHFDCLKFLRETAKVPWDHPGPQECHEWVEQLVYDREHPECLQYLLDNNCPLPEGWRYEHGKLYT